MQREQQEARSEGSADADLEVLSQLEVYLNSQKITAGIERNLALSQTYRARLVVGERERVSARGESGASSKAVKPEEVVGIYDKLIANISEMLQLPGETHERAARARGKEAGRRGQGGRPAEGGGRQARGRGLRLAAVLCR